MAVRSALATTSSVRSPPSGHERRWRRHGRRGRRGIEDKCLETGPAAWSDLPGQNHLLPPTRCDRTLRGKSVGVESRNRSDLAPRSSGKENRHNRETFRRNPAGSNPVRQSWASSRKRVLRGGGQPPLRSVDSSIKRCAIEPRNFLVASLRPGQMRGPRQATYSWPTQPAWSHRGRRTWRMITRVPRELGRPCRLHRRCRLGHRLTNSRLIHSRVLGSWGRIKDDKKISQNEGNEVQRNGRQGVAAPHSTGEPGEPSRGTPGREGGAVSGTVGGKHARYIET